MFLEVTERIVCHNERIEARAPSPLRTVVIAMSVPEAILARFRAEFPEIRFMVPSDGTDG